jgi:uncharacterized protein YkwD
MKLRLLVFFLTPMLVAFCMITFCEPVDAFLLKRPRQVYYPQTQVVQTSEVKTTVTATIVDDTDAEMLCLQLVNEERQRRKLPPLEYCPILAEASSRWSSTMQRTGFRHGSGHEIIARGGQSGEFAHRIWMNSPPHRAALLNPRYTEVGFGMVNGYWTGRFR